MSMLLTLQLLKRHTVGMEIDEEALYNYIGQKIRAFRLGRKVTQDQLAKEIGVTRTSISNIEAGIQKLPLQALYRICVVLNVEVENLLPTLNQLAKSQDDQTIEIGGEIKQLSPKTARFVRGALEDLSHDNDE